MQEFLIKVRVATPLENAPGRFLQFIRRFLKYANWHDTMPVCPEGKVIWDKQMDVDARTEKGAEAKLRWNHHWRNCPKCHERGPYITINHTNFEDISIELA